MGFGFNCWGEKINLNSHITCYPVAANTAKNEIEHCKYLSFTAYTLKFVYSPHMTMLRIPINP